MRVNKCKCLVYVLLVMTALSGCVGSGCQGTKDKDIVVETGATNTDWSTDYRIGGK